MTDNENLMQICHLLEQFKSRLKKCVEWASPCGWGFADTIADIYYEHFPEEV